MKTGNSVQVPRLLKGSVLAAFLAAAAIFAVMLEMEKKILGDYERGTIYVAAQEIPKGMSITEQNAEQFIRQENLDVTVIPKTALKSPQELERLVAKEGIDAGTLLTKGMFETQKEILKEMSSPVIAGFRAEDLFQVAGGVLRPGDRIHIYTVSETGLAGVIRENVFVESVFDGAGNTIAAGNTTSVAQRVNIYLDASEVERFYTELANGSLRVVKVCE